MGRGLDGRAVLVGHALAEEVARARGGQQLQRLAAGELVLLLDQRDAVLPHLQHLGDVVGVAVVFHRAGRVGGALGEVEARAEPAVAGVAHLVQQGFVKGRVGVLEHVVDGAAVGGDHGGDVVVGLHAPFDLEGADARVHKFAQVRDHAQVVGGIEVGAVRVLEHGQVLAGALLLHQRVLPAAGLRALALVGVAARQVVAQHAAPGVRRAHRAVHEGLDLQRLGRVAPDAAHVLHIQLAGEHHALDAVAVPERGGAPVERVGLRGQVQREARRDLPADLHRGGVGHDGGVHADALERDRVLRKGVQIAVVEVGVHGHVQRFTAGMDGIHRAAQRVGVKIARIGAQAEAAAAHVHRVRAEAQRGLQLAGPARRGEQFRSHHVQFPPDVDRARQCAAPCVIFIADFSGRRPPTAGGTPRPPRCAPPASW